MADLSNENYDTFSKLSGCLLPCTVYKYSYEKMTESNSLERTNGSSSITLEVDRVGMTILKETYLYDGFNLIGEIGGSLGLFLGLSCVSIFEFFKMHTWKIINQNN